MIAFPFQIQLRVTFRNLIVIRMNGYVYFVDVMDEMIEENEL